MYPVISYSNLAFGLCDLPETIKQIIQQLKTGDFFFLNKRSSVYVRFSVFLFLIFIYLVAQAGLSWASQVVLVVKNLPANAGDIRDASSIPGLGTSLGSIGLHRVATK